MNRVMNSIDDLEEIAHSYGITLGDLFRANPWLRDHQDRLGYCVMIIIPPRRPSPPAKPWRLGELSETYETGGRGAGTVSSGVGDPGGISYGSYQMTSKPDGGTVQAFVTEPGFPWTADFTGLRPGSPEFSATWRRLAKREPVAFAASQHDYIKRRYFDVLARKIETGYGLDITTHAHALQDVIWSTAVQMGPNTAVVRRAFANMQADGTFDPDAADFDRNAIIAVYRERGRRRADGSLAYFSSSSAAVQAGIASRFENEQREALQMLASGA